MIASREYVKDLITKLLKSVGFKKEFNKYSMDETIIGSWIDGKPIYRKVTIINCFEIYDTNDILYNILDEHDYVFNTAGMNKKSDIFHGYIDKKELLTK